MKLIDTKGRLFGLINIIDLGVIVVIVVSIYVFFNLAKNATLGYPTYIEAKVAFKSVPLDVMEKIHQGDKSKNLKLTRFEKKGEYEKNGKRFAEIHAWMEISLRVKDVLVGNRGEKVSSYFLEGEEINVYDPLTFTTSKYSLHGTILNIGRMDREIEVILNPNFPEEVIDAIKVGDIVSRWQHIVGEVLSKERISQGRVKIKLHIKRGEVSLKIGEQFPFETDRYYVYGTIVNSIPYVRREPLI